MSPHDVAILERALQRERRAREQAEQILEDKARELYRANCDLVAEREMLEAANQQLEDALVEQARSEKAVRLAHAETESLLASLSAILVGLDDEARVTRWNAAAHRDLGRSAAEMLGQPLADCATLEDWPRLQAAIASCARDGHTVRFDDLRYRRSDGTPGFLVASVSRMSLGAASHDGVIFLAADVTDRHHLQSRLAEAQKLEAVGQLSAGIAHEINTPTQYIGDNIDFIRSSVASMLEVIRAYQAALDAATRGASPHEELRRAGEKAAEADLDYLTDEVPRAIDQAAQGVERVAGIVSAMKDFAHPGSAEKIPTDLNRAIRSTVAVARGEWKYVADVALDLDPQLPQIQSFPDEINRMVLNLVVNAAHAIGDACEGSDCPRGRIAVSTRVEGDHVLVSVEDSGCGIPEEIRHRIFDPFFTTKEVGRGTGQGLAIVRGIVVERHGGAIDFDTERGRGTTFRVRLPIHASEEERAVAA